MILLVDTNVARLANEVVPSEELEACYERCVDLLEAITRGDHVVVLDAGDEIYGEYLMNLNPYGRQRGVGDAFAKWLYDHRFMEEHCRLVPITRNDNSDGECWYDELPAIDDVRTDPSDRKFLAAAYAHHILHNEAAPIYEAIDSKWWGWRAALERIGVRVEFLCADYVESHYLAAFGDAS